MDPLLSDCYLWLYDQLEYVRLATATCNDVARRELEERRAEQEDNEDDDEEADDPEERKRQAALAQADVTSRFVRAMKWVMESGRDGPPPEDGKEGGGRPSSFSRRHPSSCGSSNGSFTSLFNFSSPAQQPQPNSNNTNDGAAAAAGELLLTPVGPSSWTVLTDPLRVLVVSVLCDLTQVPFLNVWVCGMVGQGRLPELGPPFTSYRAIFSAILQHEGPMGLLAGALPVCVLGLCEHWHLIQSQLEGDEDDYTPPKLKASKGHHHHHNEHSQQGQEEEEEEEEEEEGPYSLAGLQPPRVRDYLFLWTHGGSLLLLQADALRRRLLRLPPRQTPHSSSKSSHQPHAGPTPSSSSSLSSASSPSAHKRRPSNLSSSGSLSQLHQHQQPQTGTQWLLCGWKDPSTVLVRVSRALLLHPLQLLALHAMADPRPECRSYLGTIRMLRREFGGWGGLWAGGYTTVAMALCREPLLCLFSVPFLVRSRRMLLRQQQQATAAAAGGGAVLAVPPAAGSLVGRQTLRMLAHMLRKEGVWALLAGTRALAWGSLPSLSAWFATRVLLRLLLPASPHKRRRDEHRVSYLQYLMHPDTQWTHSNHRPQHQHPSSLHLVASASSSVSLSSLAASRQRPSHRLLLLPLDSPPAARDGWATDGMSSPPHTLHHHHHHHHHLHHHHHHHASPPAPATARRTGALPSSSSQPPSSSSRPAPPPGGVAPYLLQTPTTSSPNSPGYEGDRSAGSTPSTNGSSSQQQEQVGSVAPPPLAVPPPPAAAAAPSSTLAR